jgi:hypothetical protein
MTEPAPATPPRFEPGAFVRTPSGAIAQIVAIYPHLGEVLVRWKNLEEARFRSGLLKLLPAGAQP